LTLIALLAACSARSDPSPSGTDEAPIAVAPPDTTRGEDAGPFAACLVDSDCVAVPQVGCCDNGWLAAVNRGEVRAYEGSFVCPEEHPICPMYRVDDRRLAKCVTKRCEMVGVKDGGECRAPPCP
jgi:hypothetical protein